MKVAGAPISWGVSELPAWGYQMSPDRVLAEMKEAGLEATELGPPGYLPEDPAARLDLLDRYGLRLVGGFLPPCFTNVIAPRLKRSREKPERSRRLGRRDPRSGGRALPGESYDRDERLSPPEWVRLAETLAAAEEVASAHRLHLAFHPHVGTAVARKEDIDTVLETTSVDICLDTGHLYLGGADPLAIARDAAGRVSHVHLKDVDAEVADRIRSGLFTHTLRAFALTYRPLGQGDLDIEAVFTRLQDAGYRGWYVLEQDTALTAEPELTRGPVAAAQQSLEYFRRIATPSNTPHCPRRTEGMSRTRGIIGLAAVCLFVAACSSGSTGTTSSPSTATGGSSLSFYFVTHGDNGTFWSVVQKGRSRPPRTSAPRSTTRAATTTTRRNVSSSARP